MTTPNERISQRAKELGLSQAELARRTGLTKGAVNHWFRGISVPNGENLIKIAKALNTTPRWILYGKGPKEAPKLIDQLPEAIKTAIMPASDGAKMLGMHPDQLDERLRKIVMEYMPVAEWQDEEDLAEHGDYVFVPRIDIKASCGDGVCVLHEEPLDQRQAFRAEWFAQKGIKPEHAACIYATGDSMEPRIFEGDTLLIDRSPTARERIINGKIYLIRYGDEIRVKQLFKHVDGSLTIRSFNRDKYPDEQLPPSVLENGGIEVLGRVVWIGGEL